MDRTITEDKPTEGAHKKVANDKTRERMGLGDVRQAAEL